MPNIKFSHPYQKLMDCNGEVVKEAKLLGVFNVDLSDIRKDLIDYDTDCGVYQLPDSGIFMMLLFLKPSLSGGHNTFITLRRHTYEKQVYYGKLIGETLDVVLV